MRLLRVQPVAAAALFLFSILSSSSISTFFVNAEEKYVALQPFRGVSICAPISVRIVDAAATNTSGGGGSSSSSNSNGNGNGGFSARLVGEKGAIDAVSLTTTGTSLSVQLSRDLDTGPGTLELEIALPAGTLQYVERVHAPGDTVILSEFDPEKAEFASSGAGSVWIPFLNGRQDDASRTATRRTTAKGKTSPRRLSMSKISLSAPGKVVAAGDAGFWEIFTADEKAEVRIDGVAVAADSGKGGGGDGNGGESPYSTVSVRLDSGKALINPAAAPSSSPSEKESHVSITGFALAPAKARPAVLEYSSGQCSARREVIGGGGGGGGGSYGGSGGGGETEALSGSACDKVAALPLPAPAPPLSWSCAIRTAGSWNCGGPGLKGRPGTVATGTVCAATREQAESIARV